MTLDELQAEVEKAEGCYRDPANAFIVVQAPPRKKFARRYRVAAGLMGDVIGGGVGYLNVSLKCSEVRAFLVRARKEQTTTMNDRHDVNLICSFCGSEQTRSLPKQVQSPRFVEACENCWPKGKKGERVRYGSPERLRGHGDEEFYDKHLTRGAIYTIERVRQWRHGREFTFKETGRAEWHSEAFVPLTFDKQTRVTKLAAYYGKLTVQAEGHVPCNCDRCELRNAVGARLDALIAEEWPEQ